MWDATWAQFHADSNVEFDEALDTVQIPCKNVDVIHRRCKYQDPIQLPDSMGWEVYSNTVEEGMLEASQRGVYPDMKYATCEGWKQHVTRLTQVAELDLIMATA